MRYLVVNADDFGICSGVNRGIVDAHRRGIVTSASLMVGSRRSEEAARLAGECPALSVGLHVVLAPEPGGAVPEETAADACRAALEEQLMSFTELLGRWPTHLDSHHHVHPRPGVLPAFREVAQRCGIPLRACSEVRYCSGFYGRWGGQSHPGEVSVARLLRLIDTEVGDGVTELGCHPGHPDPELRSTYATERSLELQALCDPRVRRVLDLRGIRLIGFGEVARRRSAPA
jgi:chitin disaccharide deacetylase